ETVDPEPQQAMEALETMQAPAEAIAFSESPVFETPAPVEEPVEIADEAAAEAYDDAMLDLIAAEMSAPDPIGLNESFELVVAEPAPIAADIFAESPAPIAAAIKPEI